MALPTIPTYPLPTADELPTPRGAWQPETGRIALLVPDMQRYFPSRFDADAAPLAPAVANLARLLERCRAVGIPVFYTAQRGNQDRRDRGLQPDLWGPGMQAIEEHEAVIDALAPAPGDHVLVKHRYSAFQRSNLEQLMRVRGRDQLLITGVYAHIGLLSTATEAFQRDIETFIAADAVADFSRADHDMALAWIARTCGVPLATDRLLEILQ